MVDILNVPLAVGVPGYPPVRRGVGIIVVPDMDRIGEDHKEKGQSLSDDQVVALCKSEVQRMAREIAEYKRPRRILVRFEPLEKTTTQKVKRYLYSMPDTED